MKKILSAVLLVFCAVLMMAETGKKPKYIFLFIGDGMSTPQRMIAEEFARKSGYGNIVFNVFPYHATTRTCSADSLVTDSAASGTALACGSKTNNGRIGMDAAGKERLESTAEAAHKSGKRVGIVTSVTINHATPAAFYAHRPSRSQSYEIGLDLLDSGFEYFGGGGLSGHNDTENASYQGDIYELAAKKGYKVTCGEAEFDTITTADKMVFARSGEGSLPYNIDKAEDVPTLADFTRKGIEILENPDGFFMMVEGGSIDWCGHSNDAASNLYEVFGLDQAVRVALEFAEKHPDETLIVVTGDHETGGMTMGFAGTGYALYMDRLANQKCSVVRFNEIYNKAKKEKPDFSFSDACIFLRKFFGFDFENKENPMYVNDQEKAELEEAFRNNSLPNAARILISHKAGIGWTSGSHTALPVLTTATGCGAEKFSGFIDNTDVSKLLKSLL